MCVMCAPQPFWLNEWLTDAYWPFWLNEWLTDAYWPSAADAFSLVLGGAGYTYNILGASSGSGYTSIRLVSCADDTPAAMGPRASVVPAPKRVLFGGGV